MQTYSKNINNDNEIQKIVFHFQTHKFMQQINKSKNIPTKDFLINLSFCKATGAFYNTYLKQVSNCKSQISLIISFCHSNGREEFKNVFGY